MLPEALLLALWGLALAGVGVFWWLHVQPASSRQQLPTTHPKAAGRGGGSAGPARARCAGAPGCWRRAGLRAGRLTPGGSAAWWARAMGAACAAAALAALLAGAAAGWYCWSILWERPAAAAVPVDGTLATFTLLTMTYSARMPTLRLFVQHYSCCPSVAEIVLVWNSGPPPDPASDFPGAAVPVRVRREAANSLNNRFRPDPLIRTRGVLQLDDDTLLRCSDVERGFAAWRRSPRSLVGFYPRLVETQPPRYLGEPAVFGRGAYNAVLTKAAFLDAHRTAWLYWSEANAAGRAVVDRLFNCEDILMVFVLAAEAARQQAQQQQNGTAAPPPAAGQAEQVEVPAEAVGAEQDQVALRVPARGAAGAPLGGVRQAQAVARQAEPPVAPLVQYVQPQRRLDISGLSRVGISRNAAAHAQKRRACIGEFAGLFGGSPLREARVERASGQRPPLCWLPALGCVFL